MLEYQMQAIIGTDKRNPVFTVYRDKKRGEIQVYYGIALLEVIKDKKDNPELKLLLARLYNANVKAKDLIKHFGYSYPTLKRWGEALKSGDPERLYYALQGQGAPKKLTTEIRSFVIHQFEYIYPQNKYTYSKEIRQHIKETIIMTSEKDILKT